MKIFRKRYVPDEIVDISGDEVLYRDDKKLVTKWKPIRPRDDIGSGASCVYFEEGWKISKFFYKDGTFKYWYCDIIDHSYDEKEDTYVITDLLLDLVLYEDGHYEILDEDELEEAVENGVVTKEIEEEAKCKLENLLKVIKEGRFKEFEF